MAGDRLRSHCGILAALALACLPATTGAQGSRVPVIAGQHAGLDACGTIGVVRGLDPRGDGFLAVRAGPASGHAMLDKAYNGYLLNICVERGKWSAWSTPMRPRTAAYPRPGPGPAHIKGRACRVGSTATT